MHLKKRLGQFLLKDRTVAERIASAVPVEPLVIEIGPGDGALTSALLDSGHRVIGIELDTDMVKRLNNKFKHRRDFRLISRDILMFDWDSLTQESEDLVVVGNLPYHLTSSIMFEIFKVVRQNPSKIRMLVVMVQKEVAERITAEPGTRNSGILSLLSRYHGTPEYLFTVSADLFRPRPEVDGGVIRISFHSEEDFPEVEYGAFRRIVRGCFAQRRKMMRNSLGVVGNLPEGWKELGYDFTLRPEQFTFMQFVNLTRDILRIQS